MQRLSPGVLILGVFALLFALLAAYGVKKYLSQPAAEVVTPEAPKPVRLAVPLAVVDLPAGRTLVESDVYVMQMTPQDALKAGLPPAYMSKVPQILGRTLRQPLKKNTSFEPSMFYPVGMGPDIAEMLQAGERAVTVPFKSDTLDASFVLPGTTVDVLFRSIPDPRADVPDCTVTLLSRVRVLAVGKESQPGTSPEVKEKEPNPMRQQTVTLAVNETQARALKVVDGRGVLSLVLRNSKDTAVAQKGGPVTLPALLGMKEPQGPFVTEIYRRGNYSAVTFANGLREKLKLDPPYGLPVDRKSKDGKDSKDSSDDDLEVWPGGYGGWGGGWGGGGRAGGIWGGQGALLTNPGTGWGSGWGGSGWGGYRGR